MDIYHYFGNDIAVNVKGDLQTVDGVIKGQQRILRRLLTSPGSYIWHLTYGAGLQRYVGQTLTTARYKEIQGLITSQIFLEACVARTPQPIILLSATFNTLSCTLQYTEANTKILQVLSFTISS